MWRVLGLRDHGQILLHREGGVSRNIVVIQHEITNIPFFWTFEHDSPAIDTVEQLYRNDS
jgi:hypothetical protein